VDQVAPEWDYTLTTQAISPPHLVTKAIIPRDNIALHLAMRIPLELDLNRCIAML
jgi:hypothetical protein